jgi:hypothetical protein
MSLLGQPPKDLAVSNLAVSGTLTTSQLSVNNLSVASINGVTADVLVGDIVSATGVNAGSWSYSNGIVEFNLIVNANPDPLPDPPVTNPQPAGTVFAVLENYAATKAYTFPAFVYWQNGPTIAPGMDPAINPGAGFLVEIVISENGQIYQTSQPNLFSNSLVQSAGAYYATVL